MDQLLYHQHDLHALCAERPLEWNAWAHMTAFHGNASIIRAYAGLDAFEPLPVSLEHAIPYDLKGAYEYDAKSGLPTFWAANETSGESYRRTGIHVDVIGFSYLYAMELFRKLHPQTGNSARVGTLAFPDKSTLLKDTDFDRQTWARKLAELPDEFQPVVVCVYWRDYLRGRHRPFLDAGLPVVSCGHLLDPLFSLRLHDLCRRFRYACANDIAGSFALSVLSGCRFFHVPGGPLVETKGGVASRLEQDPTLCEPDKKACLDASPFPPQSCDVQRALAERLAGKTYLKPPDEVRDLARSARKRLTAQATFGKISFGLETPRDRWFALTPVNIDYDGWSRRFSHLRIPAELNAGCVKLELNKKASMTLVVRRNGRRYRALGPKRTEVRMVLDCLPSQETLFEFEADREEVLPGEQRIRAFRIVHLKIEPRSRLRRITVKIRKMLRTPDGGADKTHILGRIRAQDLKLTPFPYWLGEQGLDPDLLDCLDREFPDWQSFVKEKFIGENQKFRRSGMDLLDDPRVSSHWKEFIRSHLEPAAAGVAWKLFSKAFQQKFPESVARLGPLKDWKIGVRGRDNPNDCTVLLDAQLVIHTPCPVNAGVQRGPHLKNFNKLFEAELFFSDWCDAPGTEFQIFRVKPGARVSLLEHNQADPEALEVVDRLSIRRGTYCGFMLGPDSFTQISARGPSHRPLRYFSTLLQFPFDVFTLEQGPCETQRNVTSMEAQH